MQADPASDVKVIKASLELQKKVGIGFIEDTKIQKAQKVMTENKVEFSLVAKPFMEELRKAIQDASHYNGGDRDREVLQTLMTPVMNLKANAASFNYPAISGLTGIVLTFLEDAKRFDRKIVQIADLLYKTIQLALIRKMSGDAGRDGRALEAAFQELCQKSLKKLNA